MFKVIFACVHNAGRSQTAAAFFNQLAEPTRAKAVSAVQNPVCVFIRKSSRSCWSWH